MRKLQFTQIIFYTALVLTLGVKSVQADAPRLIGLEKDAPSVQVRGVDGASVDLRSQILNRPTILVFYQGGWSTYCEFQLKDLNSAVEDLSSLGYQLIALSPESPEEIKKTRDALKLTFPVFSDSTLSAAQAYGIGAPIKGSVGSKGDDHKHKLPTPSVFLLDQKGKIKFRYLSPNSTTRLLKGPLIIVAKSYSAFTSSEKGSDLDIRKQR